MSRSQLLAVAFGVAVRWLLLCQTVCVCRAFGLFGLLDAVGVVCIGLVLLDTKSNTLF